MGFESKEFEQAEYQPKHHEQANELRVPEDYRLQHLPLSEFSTFREVGPTEAASIGESCQKLKVTDFDRETHKLAEVPVSTDSGKKIVHAVKEVISEFYGGVVHTMRLGSTVAHLLAPEASVENYQPPDMYEEKLYARNELSKIKESLNARLLPTVDYYEKP